MTQVDTFQYSCLLPKDMEPQSYTSRYTILYGDSLNATSTTLTCPDTSQFLIINQVRKRVTGCLLTLAILSDAPQPYTLL